MIKFTAAKTLPAATEATSWFSKRNAIVAEPTIIATSDIQVATAL